MINAFILLQYVFTSYMT